MQGRSERQRCSGVGCARALCGLWRYEEAEDELSAAVAGAVDWDDASAAEMGYIEDSYGSYENYYMMKEYGGRNYYGGGHDSDGGCDYDSDGGGDYDSDYGGRSKKARLKSQSHDDTYDTHVTQTVAISATYCLTAKDLVGLNPMLRSNPRGAFFASMKLFAKSALKARADSSAEVSAVTHLRVAASARPFVADASCCVRTVVHHQTGGCAEEAQELRRAQSAPADRQRALTRRCCAHPN